MRPGDTMYVDVTYWSPNLGSGDLTKYYYEFFLENTTLAEYTIYTVPAPPILGYFRYAEAIDERPSDLYGNYYPLLNFHATYWSFEDAVTSNQVSHRFYDSWPAAQAMYDGSDLLAYTTGIFSDGTFANYWNACV